jgi:hypothetical protein
MIFNSIDVPFANDTGGIGIRKVGAVNETRLGILQGPSTVSFYTEEEKPV